MIQRSKISRWVLPLIAYVSMILGLYAFHSAWVAFGFYHGLILIVMLSEKNRSYWPELIVGWDWRVGVGAIVFGLGGGVVLCFLAPLAGFDSLMIGPVLSRLGLQGGSWLLFVFYHSLINPWFEEVFWRGKLGSNKKGPVLNDLFFAGYHILVLILFLDWIWILLAAVILTIAGWLWRQIRQQRQGLLLPVISHMSADASIMAVVYWLNK